MSDPPETAEARRGALAGYRADAGPAGAGGATGHRPALPARASRRGDHGRDPLRPSPAHLGSGRESPSRAEGAARVPSRRGSSSPEGAASATLAAIRLHLPTTIRRGTVRPRRAARRAHPQAARAWSSSAASAFRRRLRRRLSAGGSHARTPTSWPRYSSSADASRRTSCSEIWTGFSGGDSSSTRPAQGTPNQVRRPSRPRRRSGSA